MKRMMGVVAGLWLAANAAQAGTAAGTVTTTTGAIAPTHAIGYVVRDSRNVRSNAVELLLSDVALDAAPLKDELDRHVTAINLPALNDRDYVLLWVRPDGAVSMNATYSRTMTQYLSDSADGLKVELSTQTPARIEGRVYSPAPLKLLDGSTYSVDLQFAADIVPALTGTPLPAGGGEAGKAFGKFMQALGKKHWAGIQAGLSPKTLPMYVRDYNTPAENLASAVEILGARLPLAKGKVAGGQLLNPTTALLELEGERFGSRVLALVKMVKTGGAWQYEESVPVGTLR